MDRRQRRPGAVRRSGFVLYDRDNTPAIRENSVFCLTVGRDGSLWAGTDGGGLLRYRGGVFRSYGVAQGLANEFVRAVIESRDGVLWVGTDDGLFRLEGDRLHRVDGVGKVPRMAVHAIREDRAGNVWVGGSTVLMLRGLEFKEYHLEGDGSANRVKSIVETADGTIWVGTVSGLQRMAPGSARQRAFRASPEHRQHGPRAAGGSRRSALDRQYRRRPDPLLRRAFHPRGDAGQSAEQHGAGAIQR